MKLKVCVRLDSLERTLVAGAARQEHCGLDPATLKAMCGHLDRQVLIRRSAERLALYTVTAENGLAGTRRCHEAVTVGLEGLARLGAAPVAARLRRRVKRAGGSPPLPCPGP